jgi:hypothetical protein
MLYLAEDFVAAVRRVTLKRVEDDTGISLRTVSDIVACTHARSRELKVGKAEHIEAICDFVNRQLGTTFEVGNVIKTARSSFMGYAGVNLFVGGKDLDLAAAMREANVPRARMRSAGLTDVWVLFDTMHFLQQHHVDVVLDLAVPPALDPAVERWKKSLGRRFNVVLGSALVSGIFEHAYLEISRHFNSDAPHTIEFVFAPPDPGSVADQLLAGHAKRGQYFARVQSDRRDVPGVRAEAIHVGIDATFERRWPPAGDPRQAYQDVAVVMASSNNLILAGHGSAGTLAAVSLLKANLREVEKAALQKQAIILVSRVNARAQPGFDRHHADLVGETMCLKPRASDGDAAEGAASAAEPRPRGSRR